LPATVRALPANTRSIPQAMRDPNVLRNLAHPIAELSTFGWMTGTWSARNVREIPEAKTHDLTVNTYVFAFTMKNRWIFGADGKAKDEFYITFDPIARQYVLVRLEADPSYGIWVSSQGWRGNGIVFTSEVSYAYGQPYRRRVTIDHVNGRTFTIFDEEQLPDGSWSADDAMELTKQ
jgi:hypothetical protein